MNIRKNKSGFTLLEIIIVIIIVGVLASLALPRFFSTVEFSRSTEALAGLAAVRQAVERCYLQRGGTYVGCDSFANLDLENPSNSPNAHFGTYAISGVSATGFTITATRNAVDGGDGSSTIVLQQSGNSITRSGTGSFGGIN